MDNKIAFSSFSIAVFVLISSITLIIGVLFNYFQKQIISELENEANYISYAIESEGISYINHFNNSKKRITLIDSNGNVIADTSADSISMDNHLNRTEVIEAIKNGSGISVRYSNTLMEKTIYYAKKINNGNILRISANQYSVTAIIIKLLTPLFIILIIAFILSYILSKKISKSIIKPINNIDLDNPLNNEVYEELMPLIDKITAQKKLIDEQLKGAKKRQEEFKLITENMNEGFLIIDNNTNLLTYNNAAVKILEIEKYKNDSVFTLNRSKGFRNIIKDALCGNRAESNITIDNNYYNLIANPVFDNNKIIGAVIVIFNVTESIEHEKLKREFTSNVSHELKTPLTSISGFAEIMKTGGNPEETVIDFSKSIYDEAQRLITLVNDIIKLSELDEGNIQYDKENVDLYSLSKDIIKRLKPSANKKNISLNLIGKSIKIFGVKKILDEMLFNLCDNAIKYNKNSGNVDIILNSNDKSDYIIVKDTGIGIPVSEQKRVFERFYRIDKSRSKQIGGTGLGLSIVKHGAMYHNAKIYIESTENAGTSIKISFEKK